jgi:hypothetical protein
LREIALHLLDIAENSVAAGAQTIEIMVEEDLANDRLKTSVQDDGRGMDAQLLARVSDPFMTRRTTRQVGLGIPLFKAAAEACNGYLRMTSAPGQGTRLEAEFQRSHIDRMPLGDLAGTILTLVVSFPEIHWLFHYQANGAAFAFDDEPIKRELAEIPLTEPSVLVYLRELLEEGIGSVQHVALEKELSY